MVTGVVEESGESRDPQQNHPELSGMTECSMSALSGMIAASSHPCLLKINSVANVTGELNC